MIRYEIECEIDGETVRREVGDHQLARTLARDLAIATGRRAIVRTLGVQKTQRFDVLLVDLNSERLVVVKESVSKFRANRFVADWDHTQTDAVALVWPRDRKVPKWLGRTG